MYLMAMIISLLTYFVNRFIGIYLKTIFEKREIWLNHAVFDG